MVVEARARWDDVTHDHIFLEPTQVIHLGAGCRLGEHAGGVLEGRSAKEALGLQRSLRDTEQDGLGLGRLATQLLDARVLVFEFQLIHLLAPKEPSVARLGDAHFAQHLADDDLDMLVVDGHALQPIDFLDFVDEMLLQLLRPADVKDFMGVNGAFGELLAFLDVVALEDDNVFTDRNQVFFFNRCLLVFDDNTAFAANTGSEVHDALDLGDFGSVLRAAGLKELSHARQTTRDVFGLRSLARRLRHQGAGNDLFIFGHDDVRPGRYRVISDGLALFVTYDDLRMQIFLMLNDDHGLLAGGFIGFLLHRHALDDVVELHPAGFLRENRHVVRVPLNEGFALLDLAAVLDGDDRANDDKMLFQLAPIVANNGNGAVLVEHNVVAVLQGDKTQVVVTHGAIVLGLDLRDLEYLGGRATNVEGTHGELSARLANGLRGNDTHRLAQFNLVARGQVAAVAIDADTLLAFAGQHGADLDLLDASGVDQPGLDLVNFLVRMGE